MPCIEWLQMEVLCRQAGFILPGNCMVECGERIRASDRVYQGEEISVEDLDMPTDKVEPVTVAKYLPAPEERIVV